MQKADPAFAARNHDCARCRYRTSNALNQVEIFNEAVTLTGVTVTKLDGTAKGGVVFNIAENTAVPIRFIGVGKRLTIYAHLRQMNFVKALFEKERITVLATHSVAL